MNFEEMLEQKHGGAAGQHAFIGMLSKMRSADRKFVNVIEVSQELVDAPGFSHALEEEAGRSKRLTHKNLLPFEVVTTEKGTKAAQMGQGSILTVKQLVTDNPAVVATKDFCENMVSGLLNVTTFLNENGIHHLCYSPDNVFLRRYSDTPLLLFHCSDFSGMNNRELLWKGHEQFVAPEVLDGEDGTEASDVYSIGRFVEFLYASADMPLELKAIVKKATATAPSDRYQTAGEMLAAISKRRIGMRTILAAAAVVGILLVGWGVYSTVTPQQTEMEYIAPGPKEDGDTILSKGFNEEVELAFLKDTARVDDDAAPGQLSPRQEKAYREHQTKAEDIFRRQYSKQAERILARLYGKSRKTMTEADFIRLSSTVTDELVKAQQQLTEMTGLSPARGQLLASNIIDQVTNRLDAQQRKEQQLEEMQRAKSAAQKTDDPVDEAIKAAANAASKKPESFTRGIENQKRDSRREEDFKEMEERR